MQKRQRILFQKDWSWIEIYIDSGRLRACFGHQLTFEILL